MSAADLSVLIGYFGDIAVPAFSIALVFGFGSKLVHAFLSMGLDGKFKL